MIFIHLIPTKVYHSAYTFRTDPSMARPCETMYSTLTASSRLPTIYQCYAIPIVICFRAIISSYHIIVCFRGYD